MKAISLIAIALFGLTACTIRSERTVVEKPVPTHTVIYAESQPTTTTVIVPAN